MSARICKIAYLPSTEKAHIIFLNGETFPGIKWTKGSYIYNGVRVDTKVYECALVHNKDKRVTKIGLIGEMYDNNALYEYSSHVRDGKLYISLEPLLDPQ